MFVKDGWAEEPVSSLYPIGSDKCLNKIWFNWVPAKPQRKVQREFKSHGKIGGENWAKKYLFSAEKCSSCMPLWIVCERTLWKVKTAKLIYLIEAHQICVWKSPGIPNQGKALRHFFVLSKTSVLPRKMFSRPLILLEGEEEGVLWGSVGNEWMVILW